MNRKQSRGVMTHPTIYWEFKNMFCWNKGQCSSMVFPVKLEGYTDIRSTLLFIYGGTPQVGPLVYEPHRTIDLPETIEFTKCELNQFSSCEWGHYFVDVNWFKINKSMVLSVSERNNFWQLRVFIQRDNFFAWVDLWQFLILCKKSHI